MRALGIDVSVRRGLDIVCLDHRRAPLAVVGGIDTGTLREVVAWLTPDIICIDSPPAWALAGRSRRAERQLAALGVSSYATPSDAAGRAFYDWMTVGFEVFRAVADGFPLYREGDPRGHAAEVFPHACAGFLAGRLPEQTESKRAFRSEVLRTHGVEVGRVWTQDQIDAALAALTGLVALEGHHCSVGDPAEGVMLLPISGPPPRLTRSSASSPSSGALPAETEAVSGAAVASAMTASGLCLCGCGEGRGRKARFRPGHDARLLSRLRKEMAAGDAAAATALSELGWLR